MLAHKTAASQMLRFTKYHMAKALQQQLVQRRGSMVLASNHGWRSSMVTLSSCAVKSNVLVPSARMVLLQPSHGIGKPQTPELVALEESILRKAFDQSTAQHGISEPQTMDAMHKLAAWYLRNGMFVESTALAQQAVQLRTDTLGEADFCTLESMVLLAQCMWQSNKKPPAKKVIVKAIELASHSNAPNIKALAAKAKALHGTNIVRQFSRDQLFSGKHAYVHLDRHRRGLRLLDSALQAQREVLTNSTAPATSTSAAALDMAKTMVALGNALLPYAPGPFMPFSLSDHEPNTLLHEAMLLYEGLLGAAHPDTLAVRYNIAHAATALPDIMDEAGSQLGPNHPATVTAAAYTAASWMKHKEGAGTVESLADFVLHADLHGGVDAVLAPGMLAAMDELAVQLNRSSTGSSQHQQYAQLATSIRLRLHALAEQLYGPQHVEAIRRQKQLVKGKQQKLHLQVNAKDGRAGGWKGTVEAQLRGRCVRGPILTLAYA